MMSLMRRWVGSVALESGLSVVTAARPAVADVVYIGPGDALDRPVPLYLQIKEQRSELRVYRRNDKLDLVSPLVVCYGNCGFQLLPGPYRLQLIGPPDTDIESGTRLFDLRGPSSMFVDPTSSTTRWIGLGLGVLGAGMILTGVALLAESNDVLVNGSYETDKSKEFAGGALAVGGVMLSVGGWIMFGVNGKPHVEIRPLTALSPTPAPAVYAPRATPAPATRLPPPPPAPPTAAPPTAGPAVVAPPAPSGSAGSPATAAPAPSPASAPSSAPPAPAPAPAPPARAAPAPKPASPVTGGF